MIVQEKKCFICLLACALLLLVFQAPVATAAGNPLDAFLDGLETYSADFEQTLLDSSGDALEATRGTVRLRRPGMFHWSYSEPYTQEIISDGDTLWIYEEDLEQVTISDATGAVEDTPALIFSGDDDLYDHYSIKELEKEGEFTSLLLTPWDPESQYEGLYLGFDGNALSGMMVFDTLGQTLVIKFMNAERNPALKGDLFSFTPTAGMEIIDARQTQ